MKFKTTINDLSTIARLVASKGKNIDGKDYTAVLDCLLTLKTPDSLEVKAMDVQKSFAVQLNYKVEVLEEGVLPIGDIMKFQEFLARFNPDDGVTVSIEGNKFLISRDSPKKTAKITLADISTINSKETPILDKLKWNEGFPDTGKVKFNFSAIINSIDVTNVIADGGVVKQRILPWKISNGKLQISVGSESEGWIESDVSLESNICTDEVKKEVYTAFGNGIDNIFTNLDGKVKIYLTSAIESAPIVVEQVMPKFRFLAILAPYVTVKD